MSTRPTTTASKDCRETLDAPKLHQTAEVLVGMLDKEALAKLKQRLYDQRIVDEGTTCWLWTGQKNADGYGVVLVGGFPVYVHALAFAIWRPGEQLKGHGLCHDPEKCVTLGTKGRACFCPSHLRPCDRKANEADKRYLGRGE